MRNAIVVISVNTIASILAGLALHWITLPPLDEPMRPVTAVVVPVANPFTR